MAVFAVLMVVSLVFGLGSWAATIYGLYRGGRYVFRRLRERSEARRERLRGRVSRSSRNEIPAEDVVVEEFVLEDDDPPASTSKTAPKPKAKPKERRAEPASEKRAKGSPVAPEGYAEQNPKHGHASERARATARLAYVHLNPEAGATAETIIETLHPYEEDPATGEFVLAVYDELSSAEYRRTTLFAALDSTFQRGGLSWSKFAAPAEAALDAILHNAATLGNRIQQFDTAGYLKLGEMARTAQLTADDARSDRLKLLRETLASMDTIRNANERLLLELERLSFELAKIADPGEDDEGDAILEEIQTLVDQAKFYRS